MPKGIGYPNKPEDSQTIPRPGSKDGKPGGRKMERSVKITKGSKKDAKK